MTASKSDPVRPVAQVSPTSIHAAVLPFTGNRVNPDTVGAAVAMVLGGAALTIVGRRRQPE
ncbi:MAG TPA: hypothetical protein VFT62_08370 [Mycobacteriales bacterium]|nr:hypothetical protein [Mycobacteriales bacterium]